VSFDHQPEHSREASRGQQHLAAEDSLSRINLNMEDVCIISDDNELDLNPAHRTARRYLHSSDN
jgi:hypothetical protein